MSLPLRRLVLVITLAAGCKDAPADRAESAFPPAASYELDCDSSDTATAAELFCVRTDTRSGDILRVRHLELPASNGPTGLGEPGPAGRFTTVCAATSTDTRSDFYCVRMNGETGEMLLVNLQKVDAIPSTK